MEIKELDLKKITEGQGWKGNSKTCPIPLEG